MVDEDSSWKSTRLLTRAMLREIFPVSDMTLWRWVQKGTFPKPIVWASRKYWIAAEIQAWIESQAAARKPTTVDRIVHDRPRGPASPSPRVFVL